ncbi:MAG: T9SS type A sorting domain-containing protein [Bacteroidia bacterium]
MKKNYNKLMLLLCAVTIGLQTYATQITVQVSNYQFAPANVNAFVGDTMHFVWVSGTHTTTCDGSNGSTFPVGAPTWDSPITSGAPTFDYTITVAGAYHYVCIYHAPGMAGNITATLPPNPLVNITFRVDLSQVDSICSGGPHIAGSFNGWSTTLNPLTAVGGGVYEATIALDSTQSYQYKFLKDNAFSACGDETVPGACNVGGNREIVVPESDSALSTVCFGSCSACIPPGYADITFSVDMSQTILGPGGPHLAGSFNGFSATATPMTDIGGGIYQATVNIDTSYTVQYTFLEDSSYNGQEAVPVACGVPNGFGGYNRELVVPENDSTLATVCYGSCSACPPLVGITFKVDMSLTTIGPGDVHLAGTFNGFSATATPMVDLGGGHYRKKVFIPAGTTVQYLFLKDSTFTGQENVPVTCGVSNGFGGYNRELPVPLTDSVLPEVCYGSCGICIPPGYADITFSVDMTNETIAGGGVHLAGSFNGFSATATPMTNVGGNVYQATVNIDTSFTVQYTFLKDSSYTGQENVPASCGVPNGFGGYNRELSVPETDSTLATVCYSGCGICVSPGYANVTFRVDMSQTTICPGGPYLVGSFNSFSATATPMTNAGGGIYEATVTLDTTLTVQYKFLKDSTYTCGDETVPAACGVPNGLGGYNRELAVSENDTVLPLVCFSSCSACILPSDSVYITFRVDLSQQVICAGGPHIAGAFNGWSTTANPLDSVGGGIYETTLYLDSTQTYEYKFLKDSDWTCGGETVPGACNVNGNRQIIVPEGDSVLAVVCFNSCSACVPPPPTVNVTFRADFSLTTACASGPHIVGTFNNWNSTANPMTLVTGGIYEATFALNIGDTVQYKFLNDDQYSACGNENVPMACGVDNGVGGYNRYFVPQNDTTLPAVCFSSCAVCVPLNEVNVTFRVDMSLTTLGPGGPHIAATFNNFFANATPMIAAGGGVYTYTQSIDTTQTIQYTFLKDSTYNGQEVITSACGVPNGFGGYNRFIDVPETDTILPAFCYSSCFVCNVGINDHNGGDVISVYPNPTENIIYIETESIHDNFELKLFSMDGKMLFAKQVNAGYQQTIAIDMNNFAKGVYTLKIESDKSASYQKVILK